jgi:hypothetical protein
MSKHDPPCHCFDEGRAGNTEEAGNARRNGCHG